MGEYQTSCQDAGKAMSLVFKIVPLTLVQAVSLFICQTQKTIVILDIDTKLPSRIEIASSWLDRINTPLEPRAHDPTK